MKIIIVTITIVLATCPLSFGNVEIDVMRDVYESCCQEGTTSCADWKRVSNETVNVCSLTGITCNSDGFIIGIDASGFGLTCDSQIQQLQLLEHLERLDVSNNQISGIIPQYLSDTLVELFLDNNSFIGSIPVPYATHPSLTMLSASRNKLTELPLEWTSLIYQKGDASFPLKYINVAGNAIREDFPQGLAFYPLLETLDLSDNQLTGEIGPGYDDAFQSLTSLNVQDNELEGPLPEWTRYVPNLETRGNDLSPPDQSTSSGMSGGAIAGILIGTLLAVTLLIIGSIFLWKRYRKDSFQKYVDSPSSTNIIM